MSFLLYSPKVGYTESDNQRVQIVYNQIYQCLKTEVNIYSITLIKKANECNALKLNSIFTLCTLKSKVDKGGANLHLQAV